MDGLQELFQRRRAQFERDVAAMPDARGAFDICIRYLGDIRRDALDDGVSPELRLRLNELCTAAEGSMSLMTAVSQVDIRMGIPSRLNAPERRRARFSLRAALPYLPGALCAVLSAWLYLDGSVPAAVMALLSGGVSVLTLRRLQPARKQTVPDVVGQTRVDPVELGRCMDHMLSRLDRLLAAQQAQPADDPLLLTGGLMESVQMLMEARLTADGDFALKAVPRMISALENQGIEIEMYTQDGMVDFDLLPAPTGGETIRPALRKDGKLLLRGQATIKG